MGYTHEPTGILGVSFTIDRDPNEANGVRIKMSTGRPFSHLFYYPALDANGAAVVGPIVAGSFGLEYTDLGKILYGFIGTFAGSAPGLLSTDANGNARVILTTPGKYSYYIAAYAASMRQIAVSRLLLTGDYS